MAFGSLLCLVIASTADHRPGCSHAAAADAMVVMQCMIQLPTVLFAETIYPMRIGMSTALLRFSAIRFR